MHIPDGFVSGPVNIVGAAVAGGALVVSTWRASREAREQPHLVPLLATTGAFVFAAQMLNFPIGVGTSGHFLGAAALAALLGPCSACLVMTLVVTLQALVFSDGGLTALGTNVTNMAVVGCFGSYWIMRMLRVLFPSGRRGYLAAASLAGWASVLMASTACALELAISGTSPLFLVLPAMLGTHAVIGIGEALITAAVLSAVVGSRPDIIPAWAGLNNHPSRELSGATVWTIAGTGLLTALALAAFLSPFASSSPDGLEAVAESAEFSDLAEGQQVWQSALMADYSVPGVESESVSTGLAGILGTSAVFLVGYGLVKLLVRRVEKRES
ncbi:MAG: energy-coupling factor ABC transporter permease [Pirellulaceae bacterium]